MYFILLFNVYFTFSDIRFLHNIIFNSNCWSDVLCTEISVFVFTVLSVSVCRYKVSAIRLLFHMIYSCLFHHSTDIIY